MTAGIKFSVATVNKPSLLESPYTAPIVEAVRQTVKNLTAPVRAIGRCVKSLILQRDDNFDDQLATIMMTGMGSVFGVMIGAISGGVAGAAIGLAAGPIAVVTTASVVYATLGAALGMGRGILKLARHVVAPKLLALEQEKEQRQNAALAFPAPEEKVQVLQITLRQSAQAFGRSVTPAADTVAVETRKPPKL